MEILQAKIKSQWHLACGKQLFQILLTYPLRQWCSLVQHQAWLITVHTYSKTKWSLCKSGPSNIQIQWLHQRSTGGLRVLYLATLGRGLAELTQSWANQIESITDLRALANYCETSNKISVFGGHLSLCVKYWLLEIWQNSSCVQPLMSVCCRSAAGLSTSNTMSSVGCHLFMYKLFLFCQSQIYSLLLGFYYQSAEASWCDIDVKNTSLWQWTDSGCMVLFRLEMTMTCNLCYFM